jgi:hypothetical protein
MHGVTLDHSVGVEYASYAIVSTANRKDMPYTLSIHTNESIRVQSRE